MGSKLFQTVPLLMEHFHSVPVLVDESGKAHIQHNSEYILSNVRYIY